MTTTEEKIARTRREIERLQRLPPSTTSRRAGSGNPGRKAAIERKHRQLKILQKMHEQEQEASREESA